MQVLVIQASGVKARDSLPAFTSSAPAPPPPPSGETGHLSTKREFLANHLVLKTWDGSVLNP
ncbi:hypothetical protein JYU34_000575 [Plutella xylostella]|uniref:Uncharacterized protein n=1 Tax=Plutella xylostella TaxID=51655 RepID=A0ABQ7R819_PLUXY|nr:hypothetical protein JYU34_000575 [Plutella xylostella]